MAEPQGEVDAQAPADAPAPAEETGSDPVDETSPATLHLPSNEVLVPPEEPASDSPSAAEPAVASAGSAQDTTSDSACVEGGKEGEENPPATDEAEAEGAEPSDVDIDARTEGLSVPGVVDVGAGSAPAGEESDPEAIGEQGPEAADGEVASEPVPEVIGGAAELPASTEPSDVEDGVGESVAAGVPASTEPSSLAVGAGEPAAEKAASSETSDIEPGASGEVVSEVCDKESLLTDDTCVEVVEKPSEQQSVGEERERVGASDEEAEANKADSEPAEKTDVENMNKPSEEPSVGEDEAAPVSETETPTNPEESNVQESPEKTDESAMDVDAAPVEPSASEQTDESQAALEEVTEANVEAAGEKSTELGAPEPMETSSSEIAAEVVCVTESRSVGTGNENDDIVELETPRKSDQIAKDIADAGPSSGRVPRKAALKAETNIRNFARGGKMESDDDGDVETRSSARKLRSPDGETNFDGKSCVSCSKTLRRTPNTLFWEAMEYCNAACLEKSQKKIGSVCAKCRKRVVRQAMGKYCVRFGASVRQFCSNPCLEEFKRALKVCAYCQLDISEVPGAFTAPAGEKNQMKDFCSKWCKNKYGAISGISTPPSVESCSVCSSEKEVKCEVLMERGGNPQPLCSDPCLTAFKFAKGCTLQTCKTCSKLVDETYPDKITIAAANTTEVFCSKTCGNVYVLSSRKIVPCGNCKVKKYNYDMIEKPAAGGVSTHFCSLNCYEAFMATATKFNGSETGAGGGLRIASVASLQSHVQMPVVSLPYMSEPLPDPMPQKMMVRPPPRAVRNKAIICKPSMTSKGVNTRSVGSSTKETQTDDNMGKPVIIPVPMPIYVPAPMAMYNAPFPVPFMFPLPVPVPIFIPTTRKTSARIAKDIKKILKKIPSDPLEAELLMMAQAVGETRKEDDDSSSEEDDDEYDDVDDGGVISEVEEDTRQNGQASRMSGEDILQTALRSAVADDPMGGGSFMPESTIDVEQALAGTATAVTKSLDPPKRLADEEEVDMLKRSPVKQQRKRSRSSRGGGRGAGRGAKRSRMDDNRAPENHNEPLPPSDEPLPPEERPDANMMLKFTFGVNAWRFWVEGKNKELEKLQAENPRRRIRLFKKDILQLSCEELCYALCFFVKEVKKPDGSQYSPDLVYYLCLGIQEYLLENSRVENIFNDQLFEKFTDCLDEVTRKFSGSAMLMELGYIMTHIEEEHLWEAKQLGAHSPHVLLNTLMYFTTKHFLLTTAKDHARLSFPHVMKHWKKSPGPTGRGAHQTQYNAGGQRNVLLKYYPPAAIRAEMGERAKRSYEMHENSDNPLRCPIRLYEFYLSKCPESIKGKNEVFYLFPERSCVPHSPVWYSTQPLSEQVISKMLHRISLVREIQDAIINDQ